MLMLMQSACQLVAAVPALLHTIEDVCLFVFPPLVTAAAATSASTAA